MIENNNCLLRNLESITLIINTDNHSELAFLQTLGGPLGQNIVNVVQPFNTSEKVVTWIKRNPVEDAQMPAQVSSKQSKL